ncbi:MULTISPECIES: DNA cytosine methyltransferase [Rhizobium]|nr:MULTISPECIES: DNA cytosine methyltransferase [Rhizobium]
MEINTKAKALSAAKDRISKLQEQMTDKALKMASEVERLLETTTTREAKAFLKVHCGLSSNDLGTYVKFSRTLKGAENILRRGRVPFAVMQKLAMTDEVTRAEALTTMAGGAHLDTADISAIRRRNKAERLSKAEVFEKRRAATLKAELNRRAVESAVMLDRETNAFLESVGEFEKRFRYFIRSFSEASVEEPDTRTEYDREFDRIQAEARILFSRFASMFGAEQDKDEDLSITRARTGFDRFLSGRFAHRGGWALEVNDPDPTDLTVMWSLLGLTSRPRGSHSFRRPTPAKPTDLTAPTRRLRSLELCAGLGGMSLGLEAAGFDPEALIEFDADAAASLRANRPQWNVIEKDMKEVDYSVYRGRIALVAGGPPCPPYSRAGKGAGKYDERDLFPAVTEVVDIVRPKAFMFENVEGFNDAKHADHRAEIFARFADAGYAVRTVSLNAKDYGIAQERPRVFIVGMHPDAMTRFRAPPAFSEWRATLGHALEDLMSAGGWSGAADWANRRKTQIIVRNNKEELGGLGSTLLGEKRIGRQKEIARWGLREVLVGETWDAPPTDEMASAAGGGFIPGLTMPMKMRLTGLPDDHLVVGDKSSQSQQIANAVVPRVAQAMGMAIYSALLGVDFNWEAALRTPRLAYESNTPDRVKIDAPSLANLAFATVKKTESTAV